MRRDSAPIVSSKAAPTPYALPREGLAPSKEAGDAVIKVLNDFTALGNPERQRAIECQTAKRARGPRPSFIITPLDWAWR